MVRSLLLIRSILELGIAARGAQNSANNELVCTHNSKLQPVEQLWWRIQLCVRPNDCIPVLLADLQPVMKQPEELGSISPHVSHSPPFHTRQRRGRHLTVRSTCLHCVEHRYRTSAGRGEG